LSLALQTNDVILVDQRGMGLSQPRFHCSPFRSVDEAFTSDYLDLFMQRMPECLDEFEAQGIDWRWFTTEQNALDLAMVGEALGYEKVNLQGTSYGTLLGLIILRERPEVVRSAILDSVLIPAAYTFEESAAAFEASFAQMEAYCTEDLPCKLAYPNLRQTFIGTYERLAESPDSIEVEGRTVPVTAGFFAERVRYMLASVETARLVPAFIVGIANQDYDVVRDFVEMVLAVDVDELPNQALFMSMVCPQAVSNYVDNGSPFRAGSFPAVNLMLCQAWGEVLPFDRTMPMTDVPVLLLSGEFDPLTPPAWSAIAAEGLSHSQRIEMPSTAHEVLQGECGQRIAITFLQNPEAAIATSCMGAVPSMSFILHTTVTRFPIEIAAAVLSVAAAFGIGQFLFHGLRGINRTAWWASFRKMGWMPALALVAVILLVLTDATVLPASFVKIGIVQSIIPLFMALQMAAVFNPSDEPSLEIQLAAPRSMIWMLAERVFVVTLTYSAIAFVGIGLSYWRHPELDLTVLLLGWLPPSLFLSGLGIYVTVRSRMMALGLLLMGFLWFIFALFAPMFLPGQLFPAPFHVIQPFIWPLHLHASLNDFSVQDFWINRFFLSVAGIGFLLLSAYSLRDSEELLLGIKARKAGKKTEVVEKRELKPNLTLQPVAVSIQPLHQILGIMRYEFLMRWRTRATKVFLITPLTLTVMFLFAVGELSSVFPGLGNLDLYSAEAASLIKGELLVSIASSIFFVPCLYMFPILVSDAIPSDKRIHVDELMNGMPAMQWVQLLGRVLGNVLAGIVALLISLGLVAVIWYFRYGTYSPLPILDYLLGTVMAMSVVTAGAVLIGASQPNSKRAIGLAIILLIVPEFFQAMDAFNTLMPSRSGFVILYSFQAMRSIAIYPPNPHQMVIFGADYLRLLSMNILFTVVVGIIVWAWNRRPHP
jgi:pimeloyl-ACP methyl ester carboxylesterase